jgi:hypothetical protein
MPLIAIFLALITALMSLGLMAFGVLAGRVSLLWFADLPLVGRPVSWVIQSTGVMQFGDGVFGNVLCSALLLVLISCFVGLATWGLLVIEQLTDAVFKAKVRASKAI